jgi:hypothetical protein
MEKSWENTSCRVQVAGCKLQGAGHKVRGTRQDVIFEVNMKNLRTETKYALLSAATLVVWVMVEHILGFNAEHMDVGQYTQPIIPFIIWVLLFFAIREKKTGLGGTLTFMQGVRTAFFVSLLYALLQGAWFGIYSNLIHPEYANLSLQFHETQLAQEGKTPQEIQEEMAMSKMIFDGGVRQFGFFIVSTTLINTAVGAIMSLFLKTKQLKPVV